MDAEAGVVGADQLPRRQYYMNLLLLAYQSFGVVYGDLSTSPLYVYKSTFAGRLREYQDEETVFGVLSLIFWTFTLIPLLKYVTIVLSADDNGEGNLLYVLFLSSMSGLQVRATGLEHGSIVLLSCIVLVGLFALQHRGTQKVAFMFAPIVIIWLFSIGGIGLYNILHWNPNIYQALSPYYILKFFRKTGKDGWIALGGILLSMTGSEAMFADLGHFTSASVRFSLFTGIACMTVMLVTTFLMALIVIFVWQRNIIFSLIFLVFFGSIEAVYLSSSLMKVPQGGWVPLVLAFIFMSVMYIWHYGLRRKYQFDLQNKVSMRSILSLGPSLGIVRVPGIGLIYTELVTGVPSIFSHFVTNLPAFHEVLVFLCVKSVPVPYVSPDERYLVGRIGPKEYRMYRCIVRYGYKDVQRDEDNFENMLVMSIAKFIMMEAEDVSSSASYDIANEGRMAVITTTDDAGTPLAMRDFHGPADSMITRSSKSESLRSLQSSYEQEYPSVSRRRRVRFEVPEDDDMGQQVKDELMALVEAKHAGVAYIMGHSYIKARRSSSFLKKFAIDVGYSFLRKNCRGPSVTLHIPHISLIEVGMIYYV
ncbi:putative potassium transporter 2 [Dichanthelium oligosanthes]|uniref:Putative potassium transporter 2 n=1 Tax=Dichanthelium oligosanthes TaxID=888268 RepID=A0A1E5UXZ5_9POAL|nr:putative potassium transporter 2 [Dichanthelium oligosanthes]